MTAPTDPEFYAVPRKIDNLADCRFYHTVDVPGHGLVSGEWDLRGGVDPYLGGVDVDGRRVLDLGTADGFLTFELERRGAEVVSYDLSPDDRWDIVPFASVPDPQTRAVDGDWVVGDTSYRDTILGMNNAYWFCHRAFGSRARLVHGDVYSVPAEIGPVDISLFGALLLHVRDPFHALEAALRLTRNTIIVTEQRGRLAIPPRLRWVRSLLPPRVARPAMRFTPDPRTSEGADGWWRLSPEIIQAFLGVLGFAESSVSFHHQVQKGHRRTLFTVVAQRTSAFQ